MKCDRALLEAAERVAANGPISLVDAMELWDKAKDGHLDSVDSVDWIRLVGFSRLK